MIDVRIIQDGPAPGFPWNVVLAWAPHVLWASILLFLLYNIGLDRVREALSRATKIGVGGFEIEFAAEIAAAAKAKQIDLPENLKLKIAHRLTRLQERLAGARLLWIDDTPSNNLGEIRLLKNLGAIIDLAFTEADAVQRLDGAVYDLVLSDIRRANDPNAGIKFLPHVKAAVLDPPVVFYVSTSGPVPAGAFGLTNRPDELFHFILDALERRA